MIFSTLCLRCKFCLHIQNPGKRKWNFSFLKRNIQHLGTKGNIEKRVDLLKNWKNKRSVFRIRKNLFYSVAGRKSTELKSRIFGKLLKEDTYKYNECKYSLNEKKIVIKKKVRNIRKNREIAWNNDPLHNTYEDNKEIIESVRRNHEESTEEDEYGEEDKDKLLKEKRKHEDGKTIKYTKQTKIQANDSLPKEINDPKNHLMEVLTEECEQVTIRNEKRFCDFLWVTVKSGKGGSPNYKVQRSKQFKGEGYGGNGGNVILKSRKSVTDLIKIEQKIKAKDGEDFKENSKGLDGDDTIVFLPVGTIVRKRIYCKQKNNNNRKMYKSVFWYQFLKEEEELLVARGGKGGLSYSFFKKHDYRLPENCEKVHLELELRLLNDVAFIGIEKSGKTSLCSSLTRYLGNISNTFVTTTIPHVSNINYIDGVQIAIMDTPYLFLHAHKDKSRGRRILRHLYRSKLIVYVIDVSSNLLNNKIVREKSESFHNSYEIDPYETSDPFISKSINPLLNMENHTSFKGDVYVQHKSNVEEKEDEEDYSDYYSDTIKQIKMLRNELASFNTEYVNKKELVVATKCDMLHKNSLLNLDSLYFRLQNVFPHMEVIGTSAKFGLGIKLLSKKIRELLYPEYVLHNRTMYAKHIEDYVIPTKEDFYKGREKLKNYELPEHIKHMYDYNYLENFEHFLKGTKDKDEEENNESFCTIVKPLSKHKKGSIL